MEAKKIKKDKFNLNVEKHRKSRIKAEKNRKPKSLDFKVRFNILTFLTYACRRCYFNKTFFIANCKSVLNIDKLQILNYLEEL